MMAFFISSVANLLFISESLPDVILHIAVAIDLLSSSSLLASAIVAIASMISESDNSFRSFSFSKFKINDLSSGQSGCSSFSSKLVVNSLTSSIMILGFCLSISLADLDSS